MDGDLLRGERDGGADRVLRVRHARVHTTPGFDGLERFHPPYEFVVDQYLGTDFYEGSSIRVAYLTAFDAAVDPARHSVITGEAPRGIQLTISKRFQLDTSAVDGDGPVTSLPHELRSTMTVPASDASPGTSTRRCARARTR